MRSSFPGMDPFLEGQVWKGFHASMIAALRDELVARLRPRVEDSVSLLRDDDSVYGARSPDVSISQPDDAPPVDTATGAWRPPSLRSPSR